MRLIDADKLRHDAELCRETTEAFQELIDKQPTLTDKSTGTIKVPPIVEYKPEYRCGICKLEVKPCEPECIRCHTPILWRKE